jgi:hypothetical protein
MLQRVEAGHRFEHRHLDALALAGAHPVDDGREHGVHRMQARDLVGDGRRHEARLRLP